MFSNKNPKVHVLKLNFVVATINDQLDYSMTRETADRLITIFGAILPFGFIVLPGVAFMLAKSSLLCFQVANVVGILYALVLTLVPGEVPYQVGVVFVAVATSRQLVYSTVFHQTGELFGFQNYGVLLGLTNVLVSGVSLVQGPLVEWGESMHSYFGPNALLLLFTIPLFLVAYGSVPSTASKKQRQKIIDSELKVDESTYLTAARPRSNSVTLYMT